MTNQITEERKAKINRLREAATRKAAVSRQNGEPALTLEEAFAADTFSDPVSVETFIKKNGLEGDK